MSKVLATLLRLLAVPWIGSVTGLAVLYQLVISWRSLSVPQFITICCSVLPLLLVTTPIHELGHAIAARWTRHTVMLISAFGVALHRAGFSSPWRLRRTPRPYPPHCVVAITRDGVALRRRDLILVLGGVTMNFLVAILCLAVGQLIFSPSDGVARIPSGVPGNIALLAPNTPLIAALNLFAIANVSATLHPLVLTGPGTPSSDRTQLLGLLREPHVERNVVLANLVNCLLFGVRPRDWEPSLVAMLHDSGSAATGRQAALHLYYYHEDRGETAVAERHLLRAVELCDESRPVPSAVAVEAAYMAGLHRRDGAKACD
jgi:hypothetical protein